MRVKVESRKVRITNVDVLRIVMMRRDTNKMRKGAGMLLSNFMMEGGTSYASYFSSKMNLLVVGRP